MGRWQWRSHRRDGVAAVGAVALASSGSPADTLPWALVQAYQNNPQLNAQRAAVRATDETVPQALSGYRPRISLSATAGEQYLDQLTKTSGPNVNPATYSHTSGATGLQTYGGTFSQTLLNGFATASRTRQAEQLVSAARETLRLTEQTVLLNAATAYMNLIRDAAILDLQRRNVEVLQEQLRQTRDRFDVGEVTRTDVAQAELRLAAGARLDAVGGVELHHVALDLPAGGRRRARQACAGKPGRPAVAAQSRDGDHRGAGAGILP